MSYDSLVSRWKFEDMAFTVLRATYFKRTNRSFEDSDYESFGIINEKGELTNAGALFADIFSRLKYMEHCGSGFKKIVVAYKSHDGCAEGMDPTFSTPWDSFVLVWSKFNIDGIEGVYESPDFVIAYPGRPHQILNRFVCEARGEPRMGVS